MVRLSISLEPSEYMLLKHWAKAKQTSMARIANGILKKGMKDYALQFAYNDLKMEVEGLKKVLKGGGNE